MTKFNEDSRVKIPALVHLTHLGYEFLPKTSMSTIHSPTCIFKEQFKTGITKINNKEYSNREIDTFISRLSIELDNKDLGKAFFIVTELTYKSGEEEFRPDISILINGMPLAFIEVKKPNNVSCLGTAEYETNKNPQTPTNRLLTSLFSRHRLRMILKYGIEYVTQSKNLRSMRHHSRNGMNTSWCW